MVKNLSNCSDASPHTENCEQCVRAPIALIRHCSIAISPYRSRKCKHVCSVSMSSVSIESIF